MTRKRCIDNLDTRGVLDDDTAGNRATAKVARATACDNSTVDARQLVAVFEVLRTLELRALERGWIERYGK